MTDSENPKARDAEAAGAVVALAKKAISLGKKATQVVAWYPHHKEVRGPYCRWFACTEVEEKYRDNVGTMDDDIAFCAHAMNAVVPLAEALLSQAAQPPQPVPLTDDERRAWHLQAEKDEALFAEKDAEIERLKEDNRILAINGNNDEARCVEIGMLQEERDALRAKLDLAEEGLELIDTLKEGFEEDVAPRALKIAWETLAAIRGGEK